MDDLNKLKSMIDLAHKIGIHTYPGLLRCLMALGDDEGLSLATGKYCQTLQGVFQGKDNKWYMHDCNLVLQVPDDKKV